tara:strand:- start:84 stop:323 length:240 start_codon:yes stop_codon:yes gene_type:complete
VKYLIFILLFINFSVFSESLTSEEKIYFNFIDLNNDDKISYQEADQVIKLIFQLLDENKDNLITKDEIIELKNIIESFS